MFNGWPLSFFSIFMERSYFKCDTIHHVITEHTHACDVPFIFHPPFPSMEDEILVPPVPGLMMKHR